MEDSSNHQPFISDSSATSLVDGAEKDLGINYPKGKNPFGDSTSSDEEQMKATEPPELHVTGNPFDDSCDSDSDINNDLSANSTILCNQSSSLVVKRHAPNPPIIQTTLPETGSVFSSCSVCKSPSANHFHSNDNLDNFEASSSSEITFSDKYRSEISSYNSSNLCRTASENDISPPLDTDLNNGDNLFNRPKKLSISCDYSLNTIRPCFSKGPAPPLPPTGRRLIRTDSSFVPYQKLRRDIEELSDKIANFDSLLSEARQKMNLVGKDSKKCKKYMKAGDHIISKRKAKLAKQKELQNQLQRQLLDERHADLEFELRNILSKQEHLRTQEEIQREEDLLKLLVEIVEERAKLTEVVSSPTTILPITVDERLHSNNSNGKPQTFF